jgi:GNAT superfamily N-acetyltransferase
LYYGGELETSNCEATGIPVRIRTINPDDAEAVARLSGELGYPVSTEVMRERIRSLAGSRNHVVFVASRHDSNLQIAGWIDVGISQHLQTEPSGEIGGLVVSSDVRSNGIGRQLVKHAEEWIKNKGISRMIVRSRSSREAAHRFYLREGYSQTKISAVFTKSV